MKRAYVQRADQPIRSEATGRALAILARAAMRKYDQGGDAGCKARQETGSMSPQDRLLSAIFGEIK